MAYIYKITNDINGKIYIGATEFSIEKRFEEHHRESFRASKIHRPLYEAIKKYGIEHFHVEQIEETDSPKTREQYWIEYYGSFTDGYNATMGGDGRRFIDYDEVIKVYKETNCIKQTSILLGIDQRHTAIIIRAMGVGTLSSSEVIVEKYGKVTDMLTLDGKYIKSFPSTNAAAEYMIENNLTKCKKTTIKQHITEVCTGRRKTAAKYRWAYKE